MCLVIRSGHKKVYRAGYDILVFKRLVKAGWPSEKTLVSPFQRTLYKLGQLYKHRHQLRNQHGCVEAGLHSYFKPNRNTKRWHGTDLYPAIIPKGSLFVVGKYGEVVSNALRVYPQGHFGGKPQGKADFSQHTVVSKL